MPRRFHRKRLVSASEERACGRVVHDRMPVILDRKGINLWLDPDASAKALTAILKPYPAKLMKFHPVTTAMNSARYNEPDCVLPIQEPES